MPKLTVNEAGSQTFTDSFTVDFTDFSVDNAGTLADSATKSFDYVIPAGAYIQKVAYKLNTAFDDSGAGSQLQIEVGDDDDPNGYIEAKEIHVDATEVIYAVQDGAYFNDGTTDNVVNGKLYSAAGKEFKMLFTPDVGGTAYSLNELTQGNITFFFEMARL
jgi:hypothetical protein